MDIGITLYLFMAASIKSDQNWVKEGNFELHQM